MKLMSPRGIACRPISILVAAIHRPAKNKALGLLNFNTEKQFSGLNTFPVVVNICEKMGTAVFFCGRRLSGCPARAM